MRNSVICDRQKIALGSGGSHVVTQLCKMEDRFHMSSLLYLGAYSQLANNAFSNVISLLSIAHL